MTPRGAGRARRRGPGWLGASAATALVAVVAAWPRESGAETPRDVGLVERAERQLVQVDVSVSGPPETVAGLTAADFEVRVAGEKIDDFVVDRLCAPPEPAGAETVAVPTPSAPAAARPATAPRHPITFLMYFDQQFLTLAGRNQALLLARELVPRLLRAGDRLSVVSSGRELTTYADLTSDPAELGRAFDALERDPAQWDPTATPEETRIDEVLEWLQRRGSDEAAAIARQHQTDERWRAERALRLFSMVLGRLAGVDPPKAVIYFADRMRARPGEHYMTFFSAVQAERSRAVSSMGLDAEFGALAFDRVVNEANAYGVRLYTVVAEGLTALGSISMAQAAPGTSGGRHLADARDSMLSLAHETGGEAFVHGAPATRIADVVRQDLACVYLVSFAAAGLARDRALPVTVRVLRPRVEARARGQIYVPSESNRLTARLLAAFAAPGTVRGTERIHGAVIPTGFEDGKFTALVQLAVRGSPLAGATWDLGLSVLSRGEVRDDTAQRVAVAGAGTPVVLETPLGFKPGPYEIALVAHDAATGELLAGRIEGTFPDLDAAPTSVGPIAVLQPAAAAFVREGRTKTSGALGHDEASTVLVDRPTALVTLVCRSTRQSGSLRVERKLVGDSSAEFAPLDLDLGEDRCAQVRDLVRAGSMTAGAFRYELRVFAGDSAVATAQREFAAADGEPPARDPARP